MKKLPILITIVIVALAGGYFLYDHYFSKKTVSPWDVIPLETILVYESSPCAKCIQELSGSPLMGIIDLVSNDSRDSLDQSFRDLVLKTPTRNFLASLHVTQKDNFDFGFYIKADPQFDAQLSQISAVLVKNKKVEHSTRSYQDIIINEYKSKRHIFSWIKLEDVWIGSSTPVIIEDVIRTYLLKSQSFKSTLSTIYQLPRIKNDAGNIYVHLENFTKWFSMFLNSPSNAIGALGHSALLDLKTTEDNKVVLNGFSVDSTSDQRFLLSAFSQQSPVAFNLKQFIPNRTVVFTTYGVSNGKDFFKDLKKMERSNNSIDSLSLLSTSAGVDLRKAFDEFSGEIGICTLEGRRNSISKIILINNSKGIKALKEGLNKISDKLSVDTVFYEMYSGYEIRNLPVFQFPQKLLGSLVKGFDESYYTVSGNTILISSDLEELKLFLDDIDKEDTWGKSVSQNKFLESTLLESNVSVFINTPKVWSLITPDIKPKWRQLIEKNKSLVNSIGFGAIQFSHLNNSFYTNVSWAFGKTGAKSSAVSTDKVITNFSSSIKKFSVNTVSGSQEILVQDSLKNLSLISSQGKMAWSVPLNDYIATDVYLIDFFKNGKLQYCFASADELHIIDRLGNYIDNYPLKLGETDAEFLSIVDYDHTKNYRFLISGRSGKLWIYDKDGANLDGWKPNNISEALMSAAAHQRIHGKDYIIAIRDDGKAYLINRRGESLRNFPLDLNARPVGGYFLQVEKDKTKTNFVVISKDGFRIKFTLDGKILSREVLIKGSVTAKFSLVKEKNSKSYMIARQEANHFTLFTEDLKELIRNDFVGNNDVRVHYENLGSGNTYIVITDLTQNLSYIYDDKGNLLNPLPIESDALEVRRINDSPVVFLYFDEILSITPFHN